MSIKQKYIPKFMFKLLASFVLLMTVMYIMVIIVINFFKSYNLQNIQVMNEISRIQTVSDNIGQMTENIRNYGLRQRAEHVESFKSNYTNTRLITQDLRSSNPQNPIHRDIDVMLESFYHEGLGIIDAIDAGKASIYYRRQILTLDNLGQSIKAEIRLAMEEQIAFAKNFSLETYDKLEDNIVMTYLLLFVLAILSVFLAAGFSNQISVPMNNLVSKIKKIADGNFDVGERVTQKGDELSFLEQSLDHMVHQVEQSIESLQQKALVESQLKEEMLKNSEVINLLQHSELKLLQMQINPHFLFNTFNSISALATIENATGTKEMLEHLSSFVRYNLSQNSELVTLRDECQTINHYLEIQKMRFGSRLNYHIDIDPDYLDFTLPAMILQPIVENSIIHGIEPLELGGELYISVIDLEDYFTIVITDNGKGMPREMLNHIQSQWLDDKELEAYKIGLVNVMKRLYIKYSYHVLDIQSTPDVGTTIQLCLKKEETPT